MAFRLAVLLCLLLYFAPTFAGPRGGGGAVSVHGYTKSNGTYVAPHYRSAPDGNVYNNWSTVGNVNPYTGQPGRKLPSPSGHAPRTTDWVSQDHDDDRHRGVSDAGGREESHPLASRAPKLARIGPTRSNTANAPTEWACARTMEDDSADFRACKKRLASAPAHQRTSVDLNSLTHEELRSLDSACILAKGNGPAAMNNCISSQLAAFARAPKRPEMGILSNEEHRSIESACILAKGNGPASLNRCLSSQMAAYAHAPKAPDLSSLGVAERQSIDSACILAKGNGPAAMNQCLTQQVTAHSRGPKMPDLSALGPVERQSIESACILAKGNGPASMNRCYSSQLQDFNRGPKLPDLSALSDAEQRSIDSACILAKGNGPASLSKCLRAQLNALNLQTSSR